VEVIKKDAEEEEKETDKEIEKPTQSWSSMHACQLVDGWWSLCEQS
jgi:hypothetical protein